MREVRLLKHLRHENVVSLLQAFKDRKAGPQLAIALPPRSLPVAPLERTPSREPGGGGYLLWLH